ncbi:MAG: ABC transporter ATP-binding protein [Saprospiraceae bacterium]
MSFSFLFKNPYLSLLKTAWHYAKGQKKRYALVYGMFACSTIVESLTPIIWGIFINELQLKGTNALRAVWIYAIVYVLINLVDWLFHGPARVMERKLAFEVGRNFLQELYHKTVHLPVKWHQDNHSGATINRVKKAYNALWEFFDQGFMYFHTIAKMLFALSAMVYFSPLFGSIAVLMGLFVIYIIFKFDQPFIAATRETNEREHEVSSSLFDSLSNIITVITLRLEKRMELGIHQKVGAIFPPFLRKVLVNEWKWFTVGTCISIIYSVIIIGYIFQNWVPGEVFLVGGLVTLVGFVKQFTGVFQNFAWQYTQIVRYHTDVTTAQNILLAYDELHLPEEEEVLLNEWDTIYLKGLDFTHKESWKGEGSSQGLFNLDMQIRKAKKIALIGESGSGKSTLLALLRGLYPANAVTVTLDKKPIQLSDIAAQVTLFPQEPEIFENTIAYNITLGLPFSAEEVEKACEIVHFSDVITQLPNGLASSIKEKGVNLSGGQKQRLALARGVLAARDSEIVLLDEPTSSVDPKTEMLIYDKMFEEFKDKAVISSLHRLHLLSKFDYIYIMDKGRVVDEGPFDYLRAHSPIFQALWRHQEETVRMDV